jgi:hypothetical protein
MMILSRTHRTQIRDRRRAIERNEELHRLLEEIGDWSLFAGVSLVGWLTAAVAFGII